MFKYSIKKLLQTTLKYKDGQNYVYSCLENNS